MRNTAATVQTVSARAEFSAERVRRLRDSMSLTQEQLAHLLGVTFSTVNRWERDRSRPNLIARRLLLSLERRHVLREGV
ncbi:MAG: helix-turn-helix transcriptional regulator [Candidatus Eisenbacteria bacterium]|nr:helix-turn-helix transcriptional regulator [Candidatus Eisenbacteria bacterium]